VVRKPEDAAKDHHADGVALDTGWIQYPAPVRICVVLHVIALGMHAIF
jgi:hypothetical protein